MSAPTMAADAVSATARRSTLDARRSASLATLLALAWKESRTARRRLLLYMSSIALGVAALVAIDSFSTNVSESVRSQSRALLGGDVAFSARTPFPKDAERMLDSLARAGTPVARVTTFASMALVPRSGGTRLVQVRAVTAGYPFYGTVVTSPDGAWSELRRGASAIVDPSLLIALDARVGDTVTLGYARFRIAGTIRSVPGDPGIAAAIGPRVFIPAQYLPETQLLGFGARAEYDALVKLPASVSPTKFLQPLRRPLEKIGVRSRTVNDTERGLTQSIDRLSDFLGIVGLIALLLGGIGVASGVSAFVARKIDTVAVLRCLGATSRQILVIYVAQAAAMGFVGAAAGAALGVALQFGAPRVLGDFLPVDVRVTLAPAAIATGLLVGVWVALVFALRPLLALRKVSPLQAIRRDVDPTAMRGHGFDVPRRLVEVAVVASVVALAITRTGRPREGAYLSIGIALVLAALWVSATLLSAGARRLLRAGWPYVVRQGVANLYRPANQTRAVVLALGFGAFLVSTIYLVQTNLLREFDVGATATRANVLFFDVQDEQRAPVEALMRQQGHPVAQATPIITMRVAEINGRPTAEMLADTMRRRSSWTVRREYRSTFRDSLVSSERVTAGTWTPSSGRPDGPYSLSLEDDLAKEMGVKVGDTITWDVQGVKIPTRVTSLREVKWARFEPNFFAVFEPAALQRAPKQWVLLTRIPDADAVARLQRAVVAGQPNVSTIDLTLIQRTIGQIVERVAVAVRFLAVFCLAMGIPVLFSAVAATRRDRLREGVLLKTLGATRAQIRRILLAEYALLGALAALTGMVLSFGGAWWLTTYVFKGSFVPDWGAAASIAALMAALTVAIGLLTGREVFRETPMVALRET